MSILKIKDANNQWQAIQTIKGEKGDPGLLDTELKLTLLNLAKKVTWIDNRGERYYQDLWNALYGDDYMENFTRIGSPTIEGGIMTASATSWIETPESFDPGSNPWEMTIKLYRPSRLAGYEGLCGSGGVVLRTPDNSNNVNIDLYSDGGTIVSGSDSKSVPAGSWKWLKVVFGGTSATGYDYGISSDGVTYTYIGGGNTPFTGYRNGAYKTATPIKTGVLAIGHAGTRNSIAQFDLREINIKVNGEVVWTPYTLG